MDITYASAGSGKTFELTKNYVSKIINNEDYKGIYCLTFTKKATAEIKERIMLFLNNLINNDKDFLKLFNIKKLTKKQKDFLSNITELDLKVFTIDSFLYQIIDFISFENKRLAEDEEIFMIIEESKFKFALKELDYKTDNFEELIYLLKDLYVSKRSSMVKTLESENKEDLLSLFKYKEINKNSLSQRVWKNFKELGLIEEGWKEKTIIEDFFKSKYVSKFKSINKYMLKTYSYKEKEKINLIFTYMKAYLYIDNSNKRLSNLIKYFKKFEDIVDEIKSERNIIDYNDILIKINSLLKVEDNKELFEYFIFNNIGHILIDEYQDTSSFQDFVLEKIFQILKEGSTSLSDFPTIFLVGDVKQSIYEWRDADSTIFLKKEKE